MSSQTNQQYTAAAPPAPAAAPPPQIVYVQPQVGAQQQEEAGLSDCTLVLWALFFVLLFPFSLFFIPCFKSSYDRAKKPARQAAQGYDLEKGYPAAGQPMPRH